ncbi:protein TORMOZ EMBRYO DEFECTIVE [Quercus suber]|uniref:protein TORMOZ EMBRYO DEFECTIVE n=1 Tax=Quercus suber TaxID=58331 RepID=UPI0032E0447D
MAALTLKKNYRCVPSLEQFYTGGPFAVSSDGSFIACACDESIRIVDSSNASIRSTIDSDSEAHTALALSPDDKLLFSAGHSHQIRVWDLSTLNNVRSWKGHNSPVMAMACHVSGGLLATAGADGNVFVWDVDGGFCTHSFKGHKGVVSSIMFHPDPDKLLFFSGGADATVRVWDLLTKECLATLRKHESAVTSMAISEDGWILLTAGRDKVVNLWDLHDCGFKKTVLTYEVLEAVCTIRSGSPFASSLALFSQQSGKKASGSSEIHFITVGERGIVRIWNSERAVCLFEQKSSDITDSSDMDRGFTSAVMLPFDQGLLCVTADQQFLFYSPVEHPEEMFKLILSRRLVGYNEEIVDMKFLGEEEQFLAVATNLEQVNVLILTYLNIFCTGSLHLEDVRSEPPPPLLYCVYISYSLVLCRKREAENQMDKALNAIGKGEFRLLFEYVREWNTKPKLCHVAQFVLFRVFSILPPTEIIEVKGIGELLEGLIPYSHRHFSRIDRHVRSTFLLDYTLTGMSVIEPENNAKEREEDESLMHSDVKDMDDMILTENFDSEQKQTSEEPKVSSKKRKSKKSKESSSKKVKGVAYTKVDAISLQA